MQVSIQLKNENPKLLQIFLEGELYCEVSGFLFKSSLTRLPPFSSRGEFEAWFRKLELTLAKQYALKILSFQPNTSHRLAQKMRLKGFSEEGIQNILRKVASLGYLNDQDFWEKTIQREIKKGWGPHAIYGKLRANNVEREKILELLAEVYPRDEQARQAKKIYAAKKKSLGQKQKAAAFLQRRGFDLSLIFEILK